VDLTEWQAEANTPWGSLEVSLYCPLGSPLVNCGVVNMSGEDLVLVLVL
jgi:hypothetical protein